MNWQTLDHLQLQCGSFARNEDETKDVDDDTAPLDAIGSIGLSAEDQGVALVPDDVKLFKVCPLVHSEDFVLGLAINAVISLRQGNVGAAAGLVGQVVIFASSVDFSL